MSLVDQSLKYYFQNCEINIYRERKELVIKSFGKTANIKRNWLRY